MKLFGRKGKSDSEAEVEIDDTATAEDASTTEDAPSGFLGRFTKRKKSPDGASDEDVPDTGATKASGGGLASLLKRATGKSEDVADEDQALDASGLEEIRPGDGVEINFDGSNIIEAGRKKVIIGLLWDVAREGETVRAQAESLSEAQTDLDLVANFKDGNQLGFAATSEGAKPGMKAGVTAFNSRQMGRSWLAAFQIGATTDTYWVVAQRNGAVYEDQVVTGADEARMVFLENLEAPDWQRMIAPEDWELGGTEHHALADVIDPGSAVALKPTNPFKTYLPRIIALVILLIVAGAGWFAYQNYLEEQARRAAELERQRNEAVRVSPSDYPWFDAPDFATFIEGCFPEIEKAFRVVPGWKQDVISCRLNEKTKQGEVDTTWTNSGGTVPWLVANFSPTEVQPQVKLDGSIAGLTREVPFTVETEVLAEPWEPNEIERILKRRIQTAGVNVRMAAELSRMTPAQQAELRKPVFDYHDMRFTTSAGLLEYAQLFSDIPALVPTSLVYEISSGRWNVAFRIYHPAILPLGN